MYWLSKCFDMSSGKTFLRCRCLSMERALTPEETEALPGVANFYHYCYKLFNMQPISKLSVLAKVLERLVNEQVKEFLCNNDILSKHQ